MTSRFIAEGDGSFMVVLVVEPDADADAAAGEAARMAVVKVVEGFCCRAARISGVTRLLAEDTSTRNQTYDPAATSRTASTSAIEVQKTILFHRRLGLPSTGYFV
jgi:hypothetical protein